MVDLEALCDDLAAEHLVLDALVADLDEDGWRTPTPAPGWTIRDQIAHLAFADERAALAVEDPEAFEAARDADRDDPEGFDARMAGAGVPMGGAAALEHWRRWRVRFVDAVRRADPSTRVPWYGPAMSLASKVTARLMETWAHGQDVADALGVTRTPTTRLRHIAHLGVGARPFAYRANGLDPDPTHVHVELVGPGGERWTWGPPEAGDRVRGDALDFCLVVTRRRHVDDTGLEVHGDAARQWMLIAQTYAGPPGPGRRPGRAG